MELQSGKIQEGTHAHATQLKQLQCHLQRRVVDEGKHSWQIQEIGVVMHVVAYALALRL